jgi:hypothetical protein
MFAHIRRHQRWLLVIIVFGVIVSFVIFFSPQQTAFLEKGMTRNDAVGSVYGKPISRDAYNDAYREAYLRFRLFTGAWPDENEQTRMLFNQDREIQTRLLVIENIDKSNIEVGSSAVVDWIETVFRDPEQGRLRLDAYENFLAEIRRYGFSERDFRRFVQTEVGMQHLIALHGLSGKLVTPQEAELLFLRENEQVDAQIALFSASDFIDQVSIDPAALSQFYSNRAGAYSIPRRLQVSYVEFHPDNFLEEAEQQLKENPDVQRIITELYQQRGEEYYPGLSEEEAHQEIRTEALQELALLEAHRAANRFMVELFQISPAQAGNLENLAAAKGMMVDVTEPFTRFEGPQELEGGRAISDVAFNLSPENPFPEQPIVTEEAVYVIALNNIIPSEIPPLETVQERVTEDFRRQLAIELAQQTGRNLHDSLTSRMAETESFEAVVSEAEEATLVDLPPFSQQTTTLPDPTGLPNLSTLKNVAFSLTPGQVSTFTPTSDGGFILQVKARIPADPARVQEELPEYIENLRRTRQFDAFNAWLTREFEQSRITLAGSSQ